MRNRARSEAGIFAVAYEVALLQKTKGRLNVLDPPDACIRDLQKIEDRLVNLLKLKYLGSEERKTVALALHLSRTEGRVVTVVSGLSYRTIESSDKILRYNYAGLSFSIGDAIALIYSMCRLTRDEVHKCLIEMGGLVHEQPFREVGEMIARGVSSLITTYYDKMELVYHVGLT